MYKNFDDLLKSTLPSKLSAMTEGVGCDDSTCVDKDECVNTECNTPVTAEGDSLEDDLKDISLDGIDEDDLDDISEEDLAAIDDDSDLEDIEDDLDDEEEAEADETMSLVATPLLLKDELTESSMTESFLAEFPMAVAEGFLLESDLDDFVETNTDDLFVEKGFAAKTKIVLNEKDRRKQLFEIGVQASARAANDPLHWKLQKVYKLERLYKAKLRQKYRGAALKRVKAYIKRLKSSGSGILKSLGAKLSGK